MWKTLDTIGTIGSEGGEIIADEEYKESCRITLEKCAEYYSITCGVYGSMVHTTFANSECCWNKFNEMKMVLQEFIDKDITDEEEALFYDEFIIKY